MEHVTEGAWESLQVPLHPRVLGALRELGFPHMTPVQVSGQRGLKAERPAGRVQSRTRERPIGAVLRLQNLRLGSARQVQSIHAGASQLRRACSGWDLGQWCAIDVLSASETMTATLVS